MNAHAKILKSHPTFSGFSARVLNRLTEHSRVEEFAKGSVVYQAGDTGDGLYIVLSGRCQSLIPLPDGATQALDIFGPGESFGERALLSNDRQWTTVHVITDSVLLRLDAHDIHRLLDKTPRLARTLVDRLREHMRMLNEQLDTVRSELGRVVAISCVSDKVDGALVSENLSVALAKETGNTVLYVRITTGDSRPRLLDWQADRAGHNDAFFFSPEGVEGAEHVRILRLSAAGGNAECRRVASLLSHMARHFHYVVLSTGNAVDPGVERAFQRQSDLSYILFGQTSPDLYRAHLFIQEFEESMADHLAQIRPVVCLESGDRCRPYDELGQRLGLPVHATIHGIPHLSSADDTHYIHHPSDRFSANIRYLAREIGRCRVGLALSCGGAKGYAHIGVIQVLEEHGIQVDVIVGASMGAYVGALRAFGLSGAEMESLALDMEGRFGLLKVMDPAIPPRRGFMKGNKFRRLLEQTIGDSHFSDMALQLRVVTTDVMTLERVVHDVGPVSPIVQASMAMPGIVVPVQMDGRTFVDGGASDPLPVDVLTEMGVERIIAVNTIPNPEDMQQCALHALEAESDPRDRNPTLRHFLNYFDEGNILDIFMRSMHAIQTRVAEGACKQADVVLRPVACDGKWHEYGSPRRYLELGRAVTREQITELTALVTNTTPSASESPEAVTPGYRA